MPLYIWKCWPTDTEHGSYGTCEAIVVIAESEDAARAMGPTSFPEQRAATVWAPETLSPDYGYRWPADINEITAVCLGMAGPDATSGIVCESWYSE